MPIILPSGGIAQSMLHLDDVQLSTTNSTPTLLKTFRFTQSSANPVHSLNIYISAWVANAASTGTIYININGGAYTTLTTTSTTETILSLTNYVVPSASGIDTLNVYLSSSDSTYIAYTKLFQVYAQ